MRTIKLLLCAALVALLASASSCDVARQARGAYNMVNCKYDFQSLTNLSVAGINPQSMSLLDAPKILALLSGNAASIPVGATVNLAVQNPNSTEAFLNGLDYVLAIDGIDFTAGSVSQQLSIMPGQTGTLPLAMAFDVATFLKGENSDSRRNHGREGNDEAGYCRRHRGGADVKENHIQRKAG